MKTVEDLQVGDFVSIYIEEFWQVVDGKIIQIKRIENAFYYQVHVEYTFKDFNGDIHNCTKMFNFAFEQSGSGQMQNNYSMVFLFIEKENALDAKEQEILKDTKILLGKVRTLATKLRYSKEIYYQENLRKEIQKILDNVLVV